jgi:hypothetical protein
MPFVLGLLWGATVFFLCRDHKVPLWKQVVLVAAPGLMAGVL